ncbi:MAG: hypothetical protein LBJ18_01485 [Rickettsiales bacterium]|jgi:hypothetical protein|nr:hypothetical protein [Rickettsiales bacterium]
MVNFNKFFYRKIKHRSKCLLPSAFCPEQSGSGILEVLLAMAIVAAMTPFVYNRISETSLKIRDISSAKAIIGSKTAALSFVRLNQDKWPDFAQIKLSPEELQQISPSASAGFIDKYSNGGGAAADVYLAFDLGSEMRAASVAREIGQDAAAAGSDGAAYGGAWAVASEDFRPGDLVYRISRVSNAEDKSKYLHRTAGEEDGLNIMQRNLLGGGFDIYGIGTAAGDSVKTTEGAAYFVNAKQASVGTA